MATGPGRAGTLASRSRPAAAVGRPGPRAYSDQAASLEPNRCSQKQSLEHVWCLYLHQTCSRPRRAGVLPILQAAAASFAFAGVPAVASSLSVAHRVCTGNKTNINVSLAERCRSLNASSSTGLMPCVGLRWLRRACDWLHAPPWDQSAEPSHAPPSRLEGRSLPEKWHCLACQAFARRPITSSVGNGQHQTTLHKEHYIAVRGCNAYPRPQRTRGCDMPSGFDIDGTSIVPS